MSEVYLDNWQIPGELRLMLELSLRKAEEIPEGLDWTYFDALVSQHRLQPLLIRGIRQYGAEVPAGTISPGVGTPRHSRKIRPSSCLTGT